MTKMSSKGNNIYDITGKQDYRGIIMSHGSSTVSMYTYMENMTITVLSTSQENYM